MVACAAAILTVWARVGIGAGSTAAAACEMSSRVVSQPRRAVVFIGRPSCWANSDSTIPETFDEKAVDDVARGHRRLACIKFRPQ